MQTLQTITETLSQISFLDWTFKSGILAEGFYLQVNFKAENIKTGKEEIQSGRKWYISKHMTKSEVVQTAFKSVTTALEHEARESFIFKGERIFQPHFDVDFFADFIRFNPKHEEARKPELKRYKEFIEADAKLLLNNLNIDAEITLSNSSIDIASKLILTTVNSALNDRDNSKDCALQICANLEISALRYKKQISDFIEPFFDSIEIVK